MIHILKKFTPTLLLVALITFLSLADFSSVHLGEGIPNIDKLVHFCMYLTLSYVFLFDLTRNVKDRTIRHINCWAAFLVPTLIGGIMELLQGYTTTTRSMDFYDMCANMLGAATGMALGFFTLPYLFKSMFFYRKEEKDQH